MTKPERNAEIRAKRLAGATLRELADEYGLSKPRVWRICLDGVASLRHNNDQYRRRLKKAAEQEAQE